MKILQELIKMRDDTLKSEGKYSIKRMGVFSAFYTSIIYAFLPMFFPTFIVQEFVFWGFITFAATGVGMTVWNKKINKETFDNQENRTNA